MNKGAGWICVAMLLAFVGMQGCVAAENASAASSGFCDSSSTEYAPRKQKLSWQPVAAERIAEADYYGRTFEAQLRIAGEDLFAYKVVMNIGGGPAFVSVALLDRRQEIIDVKQLAAQARMLLQNEALKVVRERRLKQAYPALASNQGEISLWSQGADWYFIVQAPESFSVFNIAGNTVEYVCTHRQ